MASLSVHVISLLSSQTPPFSQLLNHYIIERYTMERSTINFLWSLNTNIGSTFIFSYHLFDIFYCIFRAFKEHIPTWYQSHNHVFICECYFKMGLEVDSTGLCIWILADVLIELGWSCWISPIKRYGRHIKNHTLWDRICGMLLMGMTQILILMDQNIAMWTWSGRKLMWRQCFFKRG